MHPLVYCAASLQHSSAYTAHVATDTHVRLLRHGDIALQVPLDKQMAKAMEERLLKGIESDMLRDKQAVIRSFMKDGSSGARLRIVLSLLCSA
jgi:hypothetical protein